MLICLAVLEKGVFVPLQSFPWVNRNVWVEVDDEGVIAKVVLIVLQDSINSIPTTIISIVKGAVLGNILNLLLLLVLRAYRENIRTKKLKVRANYVQFVVFKVVLLQQIVRRQPTLYVPKIRAPVQTVLLLQEYRVPHMVKTFAMVAIMVIIKAVQLVLHMVDRVVMVH